MAAPWQTNQAPTPRPWEVSQPSPSPVNTPPAPSPHPTSHTTPATHPTQVTGGAPSGTAWWPSKPGGPADAANRVEKGMRKPPARAGDRSGVAGAMAGPRGPQAPSAPPGGGAPGPMDWAPPTYAEDAFKNDADWFKGESPEMQYWNQVRGQFNFGGPAKADFGGYYDNAIRRAGEDIDNAAGARGTYKGSRTIDRHQEAATNLRAEQANREFDAEMRAYDQRLREAAAMASISNMAGNADFARRSAFHRAAEGAQGAGRTRAQDRFNNIYMPSRDLLNLVFGGQTGAIGADSDLLDSEVGLGLGRSREEMNQTRNSENRMMSYLSMIPSMYGIPGTGTGATPTTGGGHAPVQGGSVDPRTGLLDPNLAFTY